MTRAVVALGGNALLGPDESASAANQRDHARTTLNELAALRGRNYDLVLTHGNGPQVGALLLEQEDAAEGPTYPLDVLVAETQAQVGYVLASEYERTFDAAATAVLTRVVVDDADPDFEHPSKPIGPFYDEAAARETDFPTRQVRTETGDVAYRRVVPSPEPERVVEATQLEALVDHGTTVVCAGGGGVPVVERDDDREGVAAVVDKDHTSRLVAEHVDAALLLMVTDVPCAYRDFGTPDEEPLRDLTPDDVADLLAAGEFGEGSMAPKMRACARFVRDTGGRALVTDPASIPDALDGDAGTAVRP